MEEIQIETLIIIGTGFILFVLILTGIIVLVVQNKRQSAMKKLHTIQLRHEKEKHNQEVLVQEQIMRDLGKTLHDDFGPVLTSLGNYLQLIKMEASDAGANVDQTVEEMRSSISDTMVKVRNTSRLLYPVVLERFGLIQGIEALIKKEEDSHQIKFHFSHNLPEDFALDKLREVVVYRLIQEFLHNAMKYADADNIDIDLRIEDNKIQIRFADDGNGMVANPKSSGLGLNMTRSRVESLGGTFDIMENEPKGVAFNVLIPLESKHRTT